MSEIAIVSVNVCELDPVVSATVNSLPHNGWLSPGNKNSFSEILIEWKLLGFEGML